jgi:hypothetical protein
MNIETKLMEFVRNCYNGAGPSECKIMNVSSYGELDDVLLQWFRDKQKKHLSVVPCVHRQPSFS